MRTMKRIYGIISSLLFLLVLASCTNQNQDDTFYSLLQQYGEVESLKLTEETLCTTKDNRTLKATRITEASLKDSYFNADITVNEDTGYLYLSQQKYYYSLGDTFQKVSYAESDSIYRGTGLENLFSLDNYTIKKNIASRQIKAPNVKKYEELFKNVNLDLNEDFQYDTVNRIEIEILFTDKEITEIRLDLIQPFSYDLISLTRTITFEEAPVIQLKDRTQEIQNQLESLVNEEYWISTADVLDTYMIEMCYQYGDSIFIKSGDFDMLIDAGQKSDGKNVNEIVTRYCTDKTLDVLIATHGHGDHVGGFAGGALNGIQRINLIIDYGYYSTDEYCTIRNRYIEGGADYYSAYDCIAEDEGASKRYRFSEDLSMEILDTQQYLPKGQQISYEDNENDYSVALKLTFKNNTYLYTGDLSGDDGRFEEALLEEEIEDITVYKAAHHGSRTHNSNSERLLNFICPEICLISAAIVDPKNPHSPQNADVAQHPSYEFVSRILNTPKIKESKAVYFNGTMGTIHLTDNGSSTPEVSGFGANRGYYISGIKVSGEQNARFTDTKFYQTWGYSG